MSDRGLEPPPALKRPSTEWSATERRKVVEYVQKRLREQLTVRAYRRYGRLHPNPTDFVDTYQSSNHLERALDRFDPRKGSFLGIVVTAFHRHCLDRLRWLYKRPKGDRRNVLIEISTARLEALAAIHEGAFPVAAALERRQLFHAALGALPARQRDLLLARANGHSHEEMRAAFGYATVNAVKTKIAEARRRFLAEAAAVGLRRRSIQRRERKDGQDGTE